MPRIIILNKESSIINRSRTSDNLGIICDCYKETNNLKFPLA